MRRRTVSLVRVAVSPLDRRRGTVIVGAIRVPCALGRGGARLKWREGDGASPVGTFGLRGVHFRADRIAPPRTTFPTRAIRPGDWWCDIPDDRAYNRLVRGRPAPPDSKEWLTRPDHLYDVIVEIGFNDAPAVKGRGSGIFWHVARPGFTPTAGCVATTRAALLRMLPFVGHKTRIRIG